jgi:hypothetical protein
MDQRAFGCCIASGAQPSDYETKAINRSDWWDPGKERDQEENSIAKVAQNSTNFSL